MNKAIQESIAEYFKEDDLGRNQYYLEKLPAAQVSCQLKIKSDLVLAGLPWFFETFKYLGENEIDQEYFKKFEGRSYKAFETELSFPMPFSMALTGERIALNLLQRASSIATFTKEFVDRAAGSGISILDTRKTTPGHRALEKYAVRTGGGLIHRLGQTDMWMVKDNHKKFFGGIKEAVSFFEQMGSFYNPIEVEVHDLSELTEAFELGIKHIMLDNFTPEQIKSAIDLKSDGVSYEVSGGITLSNIDAYLLSGVDAISIGALTYAPPPVDLSLKYERL